MSVVFRFAFDVFFRGVGWNAIFCCLDLCGMWVEW